MLVALAGNEPPTEFRVFKAGENMTRKGVFLFDDKAAALVMAAFDEHAIDGMIDLEHLALDTESKSFDPDARGWYRLEVRNGELWAVNVTWTEDGAARLTSKRQRYISPAFDTDEEGRITRVFNIAITALPATDDLMPLIAASENRMLKLNFDLAMAALVMISALSETLEPEAVVEKLAEGDAAGEVAGINTGELAAFFGIDIDPANDPAGFIAAILAKLDEVRGKLSGSAQAEAPAAEPAEDPSAEMATTRANRLSQLRALTSTKSSDAALEVVESWRKLAVDHAKTVKKLADDAAAIEATKYRQMAARLVTCGAELPASAWADHAKTKPSKHLLSQSLEDLEKRAKLFEAAPGPRKLAAARPASTGKTFQVNGHTVELDARELAICEQSKCDPAVFAARKYPNGQSATN